MSHADDTILEDTVGGQAVADVARIKPSVKAGRPCTDVPDDIPASVWVGRPCADVPNDISASVERAGRALAFRRTLGGASDM